MYLDHLLGPKLARALSAFSLPRLLGEPRVLHSGNLPFFWSWIEEVALLVFSMTVHSRMPVRFWSPCLPFCLLLSLCPIPSTSLTSRLAEYRHVPPLSVPSILSCLVGQEAWGSHDVVLGTFYRKLGPRGLLGSLRVLCTWLSVWIIYVSAQACHTIAIEAPQALTSPTQSLQ